MLNPDKSPPALKISLKKAGYSVTEPRILVFNALQDNERLTMKKLYSLLSPEVDRTTVYRVIDLFESLNIVQKVSNGWKYTLELTDAFVPHHHHFTCNSCGRVISFDEPNLLESMLEDLSESQELQITGHTLEVVGTCKDCRLDTNTV